MSERNNLFSNRTMFSITKFSPQILNPKLWSQLHKKILEFFKRFQKANAPVKMRWLGAAGIEFEFDGKIFLIDPYLSRTVKGRDVIADKTIEFLESIPIIALLGKIKEAIGALNVDPKEDYDPILEYIKKLKGRNTPVEAILVGHTHWDHCADVPFILKEHQEHFDSLPKVYGSLSCKNFLQHYEYDVQELKFNSSSLKGESIFIYGDSTSYSSVELTTYKTKHNLPIHYEGDIDYSEDSDEETNPDEVSDYKRGTMMSFKLRFKSGDKVTSVFISPASNHESLKVVKSDSAQIHFAREAVH